MLRNKLDQFSTLNIVCERFFIFFFLQGERDFNNPPKKLGPVF